MLQRNSETVKRLLKKVTDMAKMMVMNAFHTYGTAKKTGNTYDISKLVYGVKMKPVQSDTRTVVGFGFETQEIDIQPQAVSQFAAIQDRLPCIVDLKIEVQPENPQRNWVVGIEGSELKRTA